jgi:hypothetical protein
LEEVHVFVVVLTTELNTSDFTPVGLHAVTDTLIPFVHGAVCPAPEISTEPEAGTTVCVTLGPPFIKVIVSLTMKGEVTGTPVVLS